MTRLLLPKHLRSKTLTAGQTSYYYEVPTKARKAGCPITSQPLGIELGPAIIKAERLNADFDAWKRGEDATGPKPLTFAWVSRRYQLSVEFQKLRQSTQHQYLQKLDIIEKGWGKAPALGDYLVSTIRPKQAKGYYRKLQEPKVNDEPPRLQQANQVIRVCRLLWEYARSEEWAIGGNPFKAFRLDGVEVEVRIWSRGEVEQFIATADEYGYQSVGTAAQLAFKLCQRKGDVLRLRWSAYDGKSIEIRQRKTGAFVKLPLVPNLSHLKARLDGTPRQGPFIIMQDRLDPKKRVYLTYGSSTFDKHFQIVRKLAELSSDLWFMRLRHSGATELGDAGATDAEIMSITGHKTRAMLEKYTIPTAEQAASATAKRRRWRTKGGLESE